ncbi:MAG TPA: ribbon-helix-helix protein, CopG family [Dehalococcoidales bacterium]|nr:ribbon-helix-helix protein, CopG family [Dehalococcoidales bacterium]
MTVKEKTKARLSVSISPELKELAENLAKESKKSKSALISECIQELARKREMDLMAEGYQAMAHENMELAKLSLESQRKIALRQQ